MTNVLVTAECKLWFQIIWDIMGLPDILALLHLISLHRCRTRLFRHKHHQVLL